MRIAVIVVGIGTASCGSAPDELDPRVVAELAREHGDAVGYEVTGPVAGWVVVESCGCAEAERPTASLCTVAGLSAGDEVAIPFEVVQSNGFLVAYAPLITASGALQADGSFVLGSVVNLAQTILTGHVVTRVDGAATPLPTGGFRFEAEIRQRIRASFAVPVDDLPASIDCEEVFAVTG
jgi:hypothetical protein